MKTYIIKISGTNGMPEFRISAASVSLVGSILSFSDVDGETVAQFTMGDTSLNSGGHVVGWWVTTAQVGS